MTCPSCEPLNVEWPIRSPGELAKALRVARANLEDGTLVELEEPEALVVQSVRDVPEDGPWPDVVQCRFGCAACGARFELSAETYHGAGGRWSRTGTA